MKVLSKRDMDISCRCMGKGKGRYVGTEKAVRTGKNVIWGQEIR